MCFNIVVNELTVNLFSENGSQRNVSSILRSLNSAIITFLDNSIVVKDDEFGHVFGF